MGERDEHRGGRDDHRGGHGRDRGSRNGDQRKYRKFRRDNRCRFCRDKIKVIDYKDVSTLQKLTTSQGKIFSRKRSGNCAKHQRAVQKAIMRARFMALLPYISR